MASNDDTIPLESIIPTVSLFSSRVLFSFSFSLPIPSSTRFPVERRSLLPALTICFFPSLQNGDDQGDDGVGSSDGDNQVAAEMNDAGSDNGDNVVNVDANPQLQPQQELPDQQPPLDAALEQTQHLITFWGHLNVLVQLLEVHTHDEILEMAAEDDALEQQQQAEELHRAFRRSTAQALQRLGTTLHVPQ